jgi:TonB family protein
MKSSFRKFVPVLMAAIITVSLSSLAFADGRQTKSKSTPAYPELAKRMNISGTVKVEVTVAPNGHVLSAKAMGGHPLLIESAVSAAKQFKYEPSPEETKEIVEFKFNGAN